MEDHTRLRHTRLVVLLMYQMAFFYQLLECTAYKVVFIFHSIRKRSNLFPEVQYRNVDQRDSFV